MSTDSKNPTQPVKIFNIPGEKRLGAAMHADDRDSKETGASLAHLAER